MTTEAARPAVGLRSERGPVLIALMLSTALVALDSTILSTAVPSVVADLGGFSQFPWLFSIYLLAQAVTVSIYGKLADLVGRKPMLLVGVGLFVVGSVLCAVAWSLPVLIAFRAIQGLGAGAILPMGQTVLGDIYTVAERARVTGYLASVWGMASVVGPTVGGLFSEFVSWRWIFWVNLPLGAVATWLLVRGFREQVERRRHRIDYAGAVTLAGGLSLIILALLEGGIAWDWTSPPGLGVAAAGLLLLGAFVLVERRAAEPILPGWVFTRRTLVAGNLSALAIGGLLFGLTSYVPTYAQGVLGTGALVAGFALAALSMGWPIMAALAGRIYLRIGFRATALIGCVPAILGGVLIAMVGPGTAIWQVALICFLIGCGLGLINSPVMVALQSAVDWDRRGVVTGTNMFARALGSAVGVAIFGAIANAALAGRPETDRVALMDAAHHVFVGSAVVAVLLLLALLLMPSRQGVPS